MILRELLVELGLDLKQGDFAKAEGALEKLKAVAKGAAVVFASSFVFKELANLTDQTTSAAVQVKRLAESFGVSTDAMQALDFAAESTGVGQDQLRGALSRLTNAAFEAGQGGVEATKKFMALGVSVHTSGGQLKSTEALFREAADAIAHVENPTRKAALAIQFFGRDGARLIPLLNKGSAGIDEFGRELEALGGKMSTEFIEDSRKYRKTLHEMHTAFTGLEIAITKAVLPAFEFIAHIVTKAVAGFVKLQENTLYLRFLFGGLAAVAAVLGVIWAAPFLEMIAITAGVIIGFLFLIGVIEDLYMWFTGGESAIGKLLGPANTLWDRLMSFEATNPILQGLIEALQFFGYVVSMNVPIIKALAGALIGDFEPAKQLWADITNAIQVAIDFWKGAFSNFFGWIGDKFKGFRDTLSSIPGLGSAFGAFAGAGVASGGGGASAFGGGAPGQAIAPAPGAGGGTNVVHAPQFNMEIAVNGSPGQDPNAIAIEVVRQVDQRLQAHAEDMHAALVPALAR